MRKINVSLNSAFLHCYSLTCFFSRKKTATKTWFIQVLLLSFLKHLFLKLFFDLAKYSSLLQPQGLHLLFLSFFIHPLLFLVFLHFYIIQFFQICQHFFIFSRKAYQKSLQYACFRTFPVFSFSLFSYRFLQTLTSPYKFIHFSEKPYKNTFWQLFSLL